MSEKFRDFLKSSIWKTIDFSTTDQSRGVKPPRVIWGQVLQYYKIDSRIYWKEYTTVSRAIKKA